MNSMTKKEYDTKETQLFELNYPLVFSTNDTLTAVVGIASTANIMVLGDIEETN